MGAKSALRSSRKFNTNIFATYLELVFGVIIPRLIVLGSNSALESEGEVQFDQDNWWYMSIKDNLLFLERFSKGREFPIENYYSNEASAKYCNVWQQLLEGYRTLQDNSNDVVNTVRDLQRKLDYLKMEVRKVNTTFSSLVTDDSDEIYQSIAIDVLQRGLHKFATVDYEKAYLRNGRQ